ncbi:MAG: hypothetical protein WKG00_09810 [Polyangiaceae bacterium]
MAKTPQSIMKDRFGEKSKLVEAVKGFLGEELWVARQSSDRGGSRGLEHVSNAKLIRLHDTFSEVKERFGTRAKLIDAILETEKRSKDPGLRKRYEAYPVPRLFDLYKSTLKRSGGKLESLSGAPGGKPARAAGAAPAAAAPEKAADKKAAQAEVGTEAAPKKKAPKKKAAE